MWRDAALVCCLVTKHSCSHQRQPNRRAGRRQPPDRHSGGSVRELTLPGSPVWFRIIGIVDSRSHEVAVDIVNEFLSVLTDFPDLVKPVRDIGIEVGNQFAPSVTVM